MPEHSEPVGLGLAGRWAGAKMTRRAKNYWLFKWINPALCLPYVLPLFYTNLVQSKWK